jgi:hypothetical protein
VETDDASNVYVRGYSHYNSGILSFDRHTISTLQGTYNLSLIVVKYTPDGEEQWVLFGGGSHFLDLHVQGNGNFWVRGRHHEQPKFRNTDGHRFYGEKPPANQLAATDFQFNAEGHLVAATPGFPGLTEGHVEKFAYGRDSSIYALIEPNFNYHLSRERHYTLNGKVYSTQAAEVIVAKFDKAQKFVWVTQFRGAWDEKMLDIAVDKNDAPIVSGLYQGSIGIKGRSGDSIRLESDLMTLFIAQLSSDGAVLWACNAGSVLRSGEHHENLHLDVSQRNQLYICGELNVPSRIGGLEVDVKGERGWNSPGWPQKIDYGKYSDGFVGCLKLKPPLHEPIKEPSQEFALAIRADTSLMLQAMLNLAMAMGLPGGQASLASLDTASPAPVEPVEISALVYPNPAMREQQLNVLLHMHEPATVNWTLYDPNGKLILSESGQYEAEASYQFSLAGYSAGLYTFLIEIGQHRITKKIIIL